MENLDIEQCRKALEEKGILKPKEKLVDCNSLCTDRLSVAGREIFCPNCGKESLVGIHNYTTPADLYFKCSNCNFYKHTDESCVIVNDEEAILLRKQYSEKCEEKAKQELLHDKHLKWKDGLPPEQKKEFNDMFGEN